MTRRSIIRGLAGLLAIGCPKHEDPTTSKLLIDTTSSQSSVFRDKPKGIIVRTENETFEVDCSKTDLLESYSVTAAYLENYDNSAPEEEQYPHNVLELRVANDIYYKIQAYGIFVSSNPREHVIELEQYKVIPGGIEHPLLGATKINALESRETTISPGFVIADHDKATYSTAMCTYIDEVNRGRTFTDIRPLAPKRTIARDSRQLYKIPDTFWNVFSVPYTLERNQEGGIFAGNVMEYGDFTPLPSRVQVRKITAGLDSQVYTTVVQYCKVDGPNCFELYEEESGWQTIVEHSGDYGKTMEDIVKGNYVDRRQDFTEQLPTLLDMSGINGTIVVDAYLFSNNSQCPENYGDLCNSWHVMGQGKYQVVVFEK